MGGNYKDFWRANKDVTIEKAGWNENDFHRQGNRIENWPGQYCKLHVESNPPVYDDIARQTP